MRRNKRVWQGEACEGGTASVRHCLARPQMERRSELLHLPHLLHGEANRVRNHSSASPRLHCDVDLWPLAQLKLDDRGLAEAATLRNASQLVPSGAQRGILLLLVYADPCIHPSIQYRAVGKRERCLLDSRRGPFGDPSKSSDAGSCHLVVVHFQSVKTS